MNSGVGSNPFYRPISRSSEDASAGQLLSCSSDAEVADPTPRRMPNLSATSPSRSAATTKKSVRIRSPPRSSSPRYDYEGPIHSGAFLKSANRSINPPAHSRSEDDSSSSDEDGQERLKMDNIKVVDEKTNSNVPYNPFSRTLADVEGELGVLSTGVQRAPSEMADTAKAERQGANRNAMDVNAFKNLLMTGKPSPTSGETTAVLAYRIALTAVDNSSSTDTSSISRQSIMDNTSHETPRSSYERSTSDNEDESIASLSRTQSKRVKPPLPKHRHGKSVSSGPQIVNFEDFSKAESMSSQVEDTRKARSSGEFKRPLPPVPVTRNAMREALANASRDASRDPTPSPDTSEQPYSTAKKAPPPPLARRSSQRNPNTALERSRNSVASWSRPALHDDNESMAESTTSSRAAPAPPPPRRSGHSGSHGTADDASYTSLSRTSSIKSPPPPPSRHRASSNLSSTSIPPSSNLLLTQSTFASTPSANTPPKPPPPRRTSSRSSIEIISPRRTSGEFVRSSFDSDRRPSISNSVKRVPITEEPAQDESTSGVMNPHASTGKDILADMDAFQREIDEMMAKEELGRRKGSSGSSTLPR